MSALQLFGYITAAIGLQILLAVTILIWRRDPGQSARSDMVASPRASALAWEGLREFPGDPANL